MILILCTQVIAISPMGSVWQKTENLEIGEVLDSEGMNRLSLLTNGIGRSDEICIGNECATCDPYPEEWKKTSGIFCHTATAWAEVFQVFEDVQDSMGNTIRYNLLLNIDLERGQKKCISVPSGKHYVFHVYKCNLGTGASCSDNEDPTDYKVKGVVQGVDAYGNIYREEDECAGSDALTERWCEGGGPNSQTISCGGRFGSNYVCENGACKKKIEEPTCSDTCSSLGFECGWAEVCGEIRYCQSCDPGLTCENNKCVKPECKDTYDSLGYVCGTHLVCGKPVEGPPCPTGTVHFKVKSHSYSNGVYTATFELKNDYKNKVIGMIDLEMIEDDEMGRYLDLGDINFGEQVTCGRAEDQQMWVYIKPGQTITKTIKANLLKGTYRAVEFYAIPGCKKDRPWNKDSTWRFMDYEIFKETGLENYPYSDLVPVEDKTTISTQCKGCPIVITEDSNCEPENNKCWSGYDVGQSACDPSDPEKRFECVYKPETKECVMEQIGCPIEGDSSDQKICTYVKNVDKYAVCTSSGIEDYVCMERKSNIKTDTIDAKKAYEENKDVMTKVGLIALLNEKITNSALLTYICQFMPFCPSDEQKAKSIEISNEIIERVKTLNNNEKMATKLLQDPIAQEKFTKWGTRGEFEYLNKFNQWQIISLTEGECKAIHKNQIDTLDKIKTETEDEVKQKEEVRFVPAADPIKLKQMTSVEKAKYLCEESSDCESGSCYNINEIEERGWLTEKDGDKFVQDINGVFGELVSDVTGTGAQITAGAVAFGICAKIAIGGATLTSGLSLATLPICGAVGYVTGSAIKFINKFVGKEADKDDIGLCIDESEQGVQGFMKKIRTLIAKALGKDVNDPWVGYTFVGLALLLLFILYLMFKPPEPKLLGVR